MLFDYDGGDLLVPLSDSPAMDDNGGMMIRISDHMAMELDSGALHTTSGWAPSDCYFDPEDPYHPCGPHCGTPRPRRYDGEEED